MSLIRYVQVQANSLYTPMAPSASSCVLSVYPVDIQTGRKLVMADWGTIGYFTVDPKISGYEEICSFTGITDNGDGTATLTGVQRNYIGEYPYTTTGTGKQHGSSAVVVFSNNPQLYASLAALGGSNVFTGTNLFSGAAPQTDTDPISPNDMTRLSYVQALVLGTLTTINVIVPGTAGATIAAGNLVYYDDATNQWKLANASTSATVDDVLLGIAQGAGTSGNPITNGVLLQGVDSNQTGLTDGVTQYATNTPGLIGTSPGTVSVVVGISKGTTGLYFAPRFNMQISKNQLDALAGQSGTAPSNSNKFEDNADTSATVAANKLYRLKASGKIDATMLEGALPALDGSALTNMPSNPFFQRLPFKVDSNVTYATIQSTSENDGSVLYFVCQSPTGTILYVSRFQKDTTTGMYFQTHTGTATIANASTTFSIAVVGAFVYIVCKDSGNIRTVTQLNSADLTAAAGSMTISGTTFADGRAAFGDGTYLYIYESTGVFRQYSISGSTVTNVTTVSYTTGGVALAAMCNGTSVWIIDSLAPMVIRKYALAGGASSASISRTMANPFANPGTTTMCFMKTGIFGIIQAHTETNATVNVGTILEVSPITTP